MYMNIKDQDKSNATVVSSFQSSKMKGDNQKEPDKLEELSDKHHHNIVTSLAERAMSVASPVVPTKEDGGVDQERSYCIPVHF